jgi:phosphatidylglycerophosphatase A
MKIDTDKRTEMLTAITPICEVFGIKDFDYIIESENHIERLKLNNTLIGCASDSVSAVIDEIIGYLFVTRFCKNRSIGAFRTQTLNRVREYWIWR